MVAVGEHLGLVRQIRAARVDKVNARQPVLQRDLLRAEVLLDRHRVVSAALHRRVVAHDHALATRYAADSRDDARTGDFAVVQIVCRELADLEERRTGVEEALDTLTRQELPPRRVPLA